jgi:mono/diheme cytochrome c family protein
MLASLAVIGVVVAGCGREDPVDLANGKELFIGEGTCGACHALDRAGTSGTQGPDLDAAFGPARASGMNEETIEGIVRRQIAHPLRNSIMPADLVTGQDAEDVAAYIAQAAGQPGEDPGALAQVGQAEEAEPVEAEGNTLLLPADPTGQLAFVAPDAEANPGRVVAATVPAGEILFRMPNESSLPHNIAVRNGERNEGPIVNQGGTSEITVTLDPGTYTFYCAVPGHEQGGMAGELTVR